jgi:hypothetical protein
LRWRSVHCTSVLILTIYVHSAPLWCRRTDKTGKITTKIEGLVELFFHRFF